MKTKVNIRCLELSRERAAALHDRSPKAASPVSPNLWESVEQAGQTLERPLLPTATIHRAEREWRL